MTSNRSYWHRHPGVRSGSDLTAGERAADRMRNGMQGAILLIAAKREDQISSELAHHDYATNVETDALVKSLEQMTREIHHHVVGGG